MPSRSIIKDILLTFNKVIKVNMKCMLKLEAMKVYWGRNKTPLISNLGTS